MNKKKNTLLYILLSLFCFVILWAIVTDAWGYSLETITHGVEWGKSPRQ